MATSGIERLEIRISMEGLGDPSHGVGHKPGTDCSGVSGLRECAHAIALHHLAKQTALLRDIS